MKIKNILPIFNYSKTLDGSKRRFSNGTFFGEWTLKDMGVKLDFDMDPKNFKVTESGNAEGNIEIRQKHIKCFLVFCASNDLDAAEDLNKSKEEHETQCNCESLCDTIENITEVVLI